MPRGKSRHRTRRYLEAPGTLRRRMVRRLREARIPAEIAAGKIKTKGQLPFDMWIDDWRVFTDPAGLTYPNRGILRLIGADMVLCEKKGGELVVTMRLDLLEKILLRALGPEGRLIPESASTDPDDDLPPTEPVALVDGLKLRIAT